MIYIDPLASIYDSKVSPSLVCSHSSHGANVNGLMVSSVSILISFNASAT
jgi:hypothetical protein